MSVQITWKRGLPSIVDVESHQQMGGRWVVIDDEVYPDDPQIIRLRIGPKGNIEIRNGISFWQDFSSCKWAARSRYRPVDREVNPVPWGCSSGSEPEV